MENQFPKRLRLSEPSPNRRTQHKNELCLKFQRGCCDYGDRCCFAHSVEELRGYENKNPRLCWRFMNGEICQYGDKCHFIHMKSEGSSDAISVLNVNGNGEMIQLQQQRKQYPWRTKLCIKWMANGSCSYGFNCCFAHGESELQNQGFSDEDGPYKLADKKVEGKQLKVKWQNNEKISRVYADWINDMPLETRHTI